MESQIETQHLRTPRSFLPSELIASLSDSAERSALLSGNKPGTKTEAFVQSCTDLPPDQFTDRYLQLMESCTFDSPDWDQDMRDSIVAVCQQLAPQLAGASSRTVRKITRQYAGFVRRLPEDGDYFGAPYSTYEVGKVTFVGIGASADQTLAYQSRLEVSDAWNTYFANMSSYTDRTVARDLIIDLTNSVLPAPENSEEHESWEWNRKTPDFIDPKDKALHDAYLKIVTASGSAKGYIFETTPEYQRSIAQQGLSIENLWNVSDPQAVIAGMQHVSSHPAASALAETFDTGFGKLYGLTFQQLLDNPHLAGIYADEIHGHFQRIKDDLVLSRKQSGTQYDRLVAQAENAQTARKPKRVLQPLNTLFEQLDLPTCTTGTEALEQLNDAEVREKVLAHFGAKDDTIRLLIDELESAFPALPYDYLKFMHRDESDMYSGDQTRDCTAYHLKNGFNAWTMAYWLLNPGFVMAYINGNDGKMLAKMGIFVSADENGLRLVVDSIETSKDIKDANRALYEIQQGIAELQKWADSRGLGEVFFCTFTNSSELYQGLPLKPASKTPETLGLYGEVSGLNEVCATLGDPILADQQLKAGYLQAAVEVDEDGAAENFEGEQAQVDERQLERTEAVNQLERALRDVATPELILVAREGNWDSVVRTFVREQLPTVCQLFGKHLYEAIDRTKYEPYALRAIIDEIESELELADEALAHGDKDITEDLEYFEYISPSYIANVSVFDRRSLRGKLYNEAAQFDSLMDVYTSAKQYVDISEALRQIFGQEVAGDPAEYATALDTKLKVIDPSYSR